VLVVNTFPPVQAIAVAVRGAGGLELGECGAGIGFRHRDGRDRLALQQAGEEALFLFCRGVFGESAEGAEIAGLQHIGTARADIGDLLHRQHRIQQRAAGAAIGLGQHDAEQAGAGHGARDLPGEALIVRTRQRVLRQMPLGETVHAVLKGALRLRQFEVHKLTPVSRIS
jgi:hypothetical protein